METLFKLLHDLVEHAVPPGNRRGELHAAADKAAAEVKAAVERAAKSGPAGA